MSLRKAAAKKRGRKPARQQQTKAKKVGGLKAAATVMTIAIIVEGLSLWVKRATHIDVFFPDDGYAFDDPRAHHFVTLEGESGITRPYEVLVGECLDLTGLPLAETTVIVGRPSGSLPVTIESDSLAKKEDTVLNGEGTVATMRLPFGVITGLNPGFRGPFFLDGEPIGELTYGMRWEAKLKVKPDPKFIRIDHFTGKPTDDALENISGDRVELRIRCLSANDRREVAELKTYAVLYETQLLGPLSRDDGGPLLTAPVYVGPIIPKKTKKGEWKRDRAVPERPCPSGFSEPF